MVEVDPTITLTGQHGPVTLLEVFEGRRHLIAYFHLSGVERPDWGRQIGSGRREKTLQRSNFSGGGGIRTLG
jgi:hypothetical protein